MPLTSASPHRRRQTSRTPIGPLGALVAVMALCTLVFGCPEQVPAGGGGGAAVTHTAAFDRGVGDAYVAAASMHEALVQGNFAGARKLLDDVMRTLQTARGRARTDEQRQILRLEDRGLQLAALIDQHSPAALKGSQDLMDAVVRNQLNVMTPPAGPGTAKPLSAARAAGAEPPQMPGAVVTRPGSGAKPAPGAKPIAAARPRPRGAPKPAAHPSKKKPAAGEAKPVAVRKAAAWPVRPTPVRKGGPKGHDAGVAQVHLATAVVGAIHAEQALLGGRMGQALGQVKVLRSALKQARAKGTPWQRQALTRLDKQANQLQVELMHRNPAAFAHASGLVDASLQVQQSFKQAGHGTQVATTSGGGGGKPKPVAKGHAKPKPKAKSPGKPGAQKPAGKPPATKPRPHPVATPRVPDMPLPPSDPTMDEDHPGALPTRP